MSLKAYTSPLKLLCIFVSQDQWLHYGIRSRWGSPPAGCGASKWALLAMATKAATHKCWLVHSAVGRLFAWWHQHHSHYLANWSCRPLERLGLDAISWHIQYIKMPLQSLKLLQSMPWGKVHAANLKQLLCLVSVHHLHLDEVYQGNIELKLKPWPQRIVYKWRCCASSKHRNSRLGWLPWSAI